MESTLSKVLGVKEITFIVRNDFLITTNDQSAKDLIMQKARSQKMALQIY